MKKNTAQELAEHLEHFIVYVSSPWRLIWVNFVAGIFRGLGAIIGASLVIALFIWVLTLFADLPLIGNYFAQIKSTVASYIKDTNYNDEFANLEKALRDIEHKLEKP